MSIRDISKYTGCLLGGAVGDALGAPVEFMSINEIRRNFGKAGITDYIEHPGNVGEFTDDTQMTLFTAEGILRGINRGEERGIGPHFPTMIYQSYNRWLFTQGTSLKDHEFHGTGVYDVESGWLIKQKELYKQRAPGMTCLKALRSANMGTVENPINTSKGCGGIMRVAPIGLKMDRYSFQEGAEAAATTHGHPSGYLSAGFFASMISSLFNGQSVEESIENAFIELRSRKDHLEVLRAVDKAVDLYNKTKSNNQPDPLQMPEWIESLGKGFIAEEALAMSLFCCLHYRNDFKGGVLAAVNHGGDSDSTGSITGNILGLILGEQAIPVEWITNLRYHEIVRTIARDLCLDDEGFTREEWWDRYPGY